jgi:hypothetical protein
MHHEVRLGEKKKEACNDFMGECTPKPEMMLPKSQTEHSTLSIVMVLVRLVTPIAKLYLEKGPSKESNTDDFCFLTFPFLWLIL